jgi:uncharacterized membrane protein
MTAPRWRALDLARGLAVVAMIVFHTIWDLGHFGYIAANIPWSPAMRLFGHAIAFAFLFIAGVSLVLANADGLNGPHILRRLARVAAAAALVTLGTWLVFPGAYVYFGILHCIAAASVAGLMFLRAPAPITFIAAAFCFAAPTLLTSATFNAPALFWLGLGPRETLTQDWRPFFPWAGALLLGVAIARAKPLLPAQRADSLPMERGLTFLGRHSLSIYLLHQPLLFGLFSALVLVAPPTADRVSFIAACEKRCVANGEDKESCHDLCVCTAEEAVRSRALTDVRDDAERGRRLSAITRLCRGRLQ